MYSTVPLEQIKVAIMDGQRPNVADIQGPEHFQVFARKCVECCCNGVPAKRPTFGGKN